MKRSKQKHHIDGGDSKDLETKRFPVIEITRQELELFFPKEVVSRLSDDEMVFIADRYGDRLWNEDAAEDLREIVSAVILEKQ